MTVAASRRAILGGLLAAPVVLLASRTHLARGRPSPSGRSTTRCALCGSSRHAMLSCPSAPRVV